MKRNHERFKNLQTQWYEKLKESGFEDIEKGKYLKQNSNNCYRQNRNQTYREAKTSYFELIGQKSHDEVFPNVVAESIMILRSQGHLINEISSHLEMTKTKPHHRQTIRWIIRYYENKWGIIKWSPRKISRLGKKWRK